VEPLGNANSILIASPLGDRIIAVQVRCDPQVVVKVYVSHSPKEFYVNGPLVQGKHWENLGSEFKEVNDDYYIIILIVV
jgi:mediator of RNA polymerase II transcription subunit 17